MATFRALTRLTLPMLEKTSQGIKVGKVTFLPGMRVWDTNPPRHDATGVANVDFRASENETTISSWLLSITHDHPA